LIAAISRKLSFGPTTDRSPHSLVGHAAQNLSEIPGGLREGGILGSSFAGHSRIREGKQKAESRNPVPLSKFQLSAFV
jgi:hypothetical protein